MVVFDCRKEKMNAALHRALVMLLSVSSAIQGDFAAAQTYPAKPIRLIVPFSTGGVTDVVARMLALQLSENFGQQVVVENRAGGAATIGMEIVAKSAPDGYTLGVANTSFAINPILFNKMPYDSDRDLAPVSYIADAPFVLSVHPSLPAKSVKELIALANSKPGKINYSSSGNASASQLATELFKYLTRTDLVHVPYNGGGPATIAVLSGEVSVRIGSIPAALMHFQSGKLRPLGVTTAKRDPAIPDVPTIAEAGVPGYESSDWQGIVVRAGTLSAVINRLNQEIVKTLKAPDMNQRLAKIGAYVVGSTTEEFAAHIKKERETGSRVIKAAGIRIE